MLNSHLMCSLTLTLISSLLLLCSQSLQLCQTLCDPMDYSPPGSSVHAISQARILEWSAISSSRGSSWPRDHTLYAGAAADRNNIIANFCARHYSTNIVCIKSFNLYNHSLQWVVWVIDFTHEETEAQRRGEILLRSHSKLRASQVAIVVKNLPARAGGTRGKGLIPGSGRSPGGGNGNPFQYSCLGNPMDRGAWQAIVHWVIKESDIT